MTSPARTAVRAVALAAALVQVDCAERLPPAPVQPIVFSHRVHVTLNSIGCTSCHATAERAPIAGIPSMERCRGCHKFVKEDPADPAVTAQIQAVLRYLDEDKPILWVRVHRLPDHVFFTHERHIRSGVECRSCHGEVEKMESARQVEPLTMGWCVACHRQKQAERPLERAHLTECITCHK